jgi:hypothetical protein
MLLAAAAAAAVHPHAAAAGCTDYTCSALSAPDNVTNPAAGFLVQPAPVARNVTVHLCAQARDPVYENNEIDPVIQVYESESRVRARAGAPACMAWPARDSRRGAGCTCTHLHTRLRCPTRVPRLAAPTDAPCTPPATSLACCEF